MDPRCWPNSFGAAVMPLSPRAWPTESCAPLFRYLPLVLAGLLPCWVVSGVSPFLPPLFSRVQLAAPIWLRLSPTLMARLLGISTFRNSYSPFPPPVCIFGNGCAYSVASSSAGQSSLSSSGMVHCPFTDFPCAGTSGSCMIVYAPGGPVVRRLGQQNIRPFKRPVIGRWAFLVEHFQSTLPPA